MEPELDLIEPALRVLIDMGYTDRENLNPATPTRFSLITPPKKIIGAAAALPGAVEDGVENFREGVQAIAPQSPLNGSNAPSVNRRGAPPVNLPKHELPRHELPRPKLDALKLTRPKPFAVRQPTTSNLGVLASRNTTRPRMFAGGGTPAASNPPSFGGGRPAGMLAGALKSLGGQAAGKSTPAPSP